MTCVDTPDWNNFSGRSCADYGATWCFGGAARPGHEWTLGATFNFPEQHCCACGKPYTTAAARASAESYVVPISLTRNNTFVHLSSSRAWSSASSNSLESS